MSPTSGVTPDWGYPASRLNVVTRGEGPLLIFLHGWRLDSTTDIADFEPVAGVHQWRRIYFDLPGMGRSPVGQSLKTLEDYARWTAYALAELSNGRPFAVVGTSGGAALALHAALNNATLPIRGLMLRMPLTVSDRTERALPRTELAGPLVRDRRNKVKGLWDPAESRASQHVRDLREDPNRYSILIPPGILELPSLIVTGRQDTRIGYEDAFGLLQQLPRATFAALDGAEHDFPYSDRYLFEALVEDWLSRVQRARST